MFRKTFTVLLLLTGCVFILPAQELEVTVTVNTPTLQLTDPKVFQDLESNIQRFMNNQRWTNDEYAQEERIKVDISLTVGEEFSSTSFGADLAIQALRPVYGSDYSTRLISHLDRDVTFSYEQFQPLEYSQNSFNDNLSSILSFYAYIILGLDNDSFSPFGGEPHFQTAQDIINSIPSSVTANNPGWRSLDGNRNRYWIIENLLSPRVRDYRQAMYDYHRQGLDIMHSDVTGGRTIMLNSLEALRGVNQSYPNSMIIQMFANAKGNEVIEIYKNGTSTEKTKVVQIMSKMDAANTSKYNAIRG